MSTNNLSPVVSIGSNKNKIPAKLTESATKSAIIMTLDKTARRKTNFVTSCIKALCSWFCSPLLCCQKFGCSYRVQSLLIAFASLLFSSLGVTAFFAVLILIQNQSKVRENRTLSVTQIVSTIYQKNDQFENYLSAVVTSHYGGSSERSEKIHEFNDTAQTLYSTLRSVEMNGGKLDFDVIYAGKPNGDLILFTRALDAATGKRLYLYYYSWSEVTDNNTAVSCLIRDPTLSDELSILPNTVRVSKKAEGGSTAIILQSLKQRPYLHWSESHTSRYFPTKTFLSLVNPIFEVDDNPDNVNDSDTTNVIGYVAIDQNLLKWNDILSAIPVSRGFNGFIIETQSQSIVGCSEGSKAVPTLIQPNGEPLIYTIDTVNSNLIRNAAKWAKFINGPFTSLKPAQEYTMFYFNSFMPHYLSMYRLISNTNYDWTIFVDQPLILLNLELIISIPIAIIFVVLILFVSAIFFMGISCCMSMDMILILKQAKKVETLELESKIFKSRKSVFSEMRELQNTFLKMVETLKEFKPFVPGYMIDRIQKETKPKNNFHLVGTLIKYLLNGLTQKTNKTKKTKNNNKVEPNNESKTNLNVLRGDGTKQNIQTSLSATNTKNTRISLKSTLSGASSKKSQGLKLATGFEQKKVSIVSICLANLRANCAPETFFEISNTSSRVFDIVSCEVAANRGFLVKYDLFSFTSLFSTPNNNVRDAINCVIQIQDKLKTFNMTIKQQQQRPLMKVFIHTGIANSYCFLGSIGNNTSKSFCVLGDALEEAENLCNACGHIFTTFENGTLVTDQIMTQTKSSFIYRCLGIWQMKKNLNLSTNSGLLGNNNLAFAGMGIETEVSTGGGNDDSIQCQNNSNEFHLTVFKLENERKNSSDLEWMYALQLEKQTKIMEQLDICFEMVNQGDFSGALAILNDERKMSFVDADFKEESDAVYLFLRKLIENGRMVPTTNALGTLDITNNTINGMQGPSTHNTNTNTNKDTMLGSPHNT